MNSIQLFGLSIAPPGPGPAADPDGPLAPLSRAHGPFYGPGPHTGTTGRTAGPAQGPTQAQLTMDLDALIGRCGSLR